MSDSKLVVDYLKEKLNTRNVYTGDIPEQQYEPSILVSNVANPFSRVLSGRKVKKSSVWRLTIVARYFGDVEAIGKVLDELDGGSSLEFQRVFTNLVMTEEGLTDQPYDRAFYDLTVYRR